MAPPRASDNGDSIELMAMNLESGEMVWAREIRDTRFYGPLPH